MESRWARGVENRVRDDGQDGVGMGEWLYGIRSIIRTITIKAHALCGTKLLHVMFNLVGGLGEVPVFLHPGIEFSLEFQPR